MKSIQAAASTCQHKFSNWIWMENHQAFEDEELMPGLIKDPKTIRIIRGFNLLLSAFDYSLIIISHINHLDKFFASFKFFTIWGMTFTLVTNILAQFQYPDKFIEAEKNRFSPWRVWKWHIFFFELAIFMELIIVPYFWFALFPLIDFSQKTTI
jgi:hypothetical protein